ncbi:pre-mRNA-processing protein 40C-like isoform X2 [Aristolochia californica]|uniref:pre-mRNA-processing protein 40C-like isoform X2 n=1 Tax=Aristolochia californica TaxID=171875 RepID=UPI0035E25387
MSSPREAHTTASNLTSQTPVSAPALSSPMPLLDLQAPSHLGGPSSDQSQESMKMKFVKSPGYVVHAPSFSYNAGSRNPPEPSTVTLPPPASVEALQPPSSGQSPAAGSTFSYNIVSQANITSSSEQQPQSSAAAVPGNMQGSKITPPTKMVSQLPIPGQLGLSNPHGPGIGPSNLAAPMQSIFSASKGPPVSVGFPISASSQSAVALEAAQKNLPISVTTAHESGNVPTFPWPPPMMPGNAGPPTVLPLPSLSSTAIGRPMTMDPSSASLRPMYPPPPAMVPPSQAPWFHPPQVSGLQRPPFVPYPGVIPGSFQIPMRGTSIPSLPLPDSQPPGVPPVGPPGGTSTEPFGPVQPANSFGTQLPPPGTGQDKQVNDLTGKDDMNSKKDDLDAWTAHKTESGVVYYYNALTGESTYERPSSFKGEPDKVTAQPTPVSCEKLAGTDWSLVTTNDAKKYYYNSKTKISGWQVPQEVTELRKKQEADSANANATTVQNPTVLVDKGSAPVGLSAPAVTTGGRDATSLKPSVIPVSSSALDLVKKKLQDPGTMPVSSPHQVSSSPVTSDVNGLHAAEISIKGQQSENSKDKVKDANGDGNMSDSSCDSDDGDNGPTKEECIKQFKEMLKERGVAPFSKWEKELPKILFDPRFKAIPSYSARRAIFEHYVRTRAEEERKEKRAAQRAAVDGFKQLLEEASEDIDHRTDYQTFKRKWGNDPRFEALDRKERELLLNEKVLPLKKAAEERRAAAASSFKSMLREKVDLSTTSRWSRVKDGLRNDPRYRTVKHEDREVLFNEYITELKAAEEEAERALKAKRNEQEKLKEREREMRKRKEREEQEMERVRVKVRRKEAVASLQALLMEKIKDHKASWTESKPKLEKDPQGRATNLDLDKGDIEKLFREHVKILYERCVRDFRGLLSEVITAEAAAKVMEDGRTVLSSWSVAKQLLKSDPRYSKLPSKDRESLWRRYSEEVQRKLKSTSEPNEEKQNMEGRNRSVSDSQNSSQAARRIHGQR